jgi:hypothetical protein
MNAIWHDAETKIPSSRKIPAFFKCHFKKISGNNRGFALLLIWLSLAPAEVCAQASREYQIKAVFLYNFSKFTDWPADAFASSDAPLVIGVLGKDPFGPHLQEAVRAEKVAGRALVVQNFTRVEDIKTVHILFISDSEARRVPDILARLRGRSILTVSDAENFATNGGMVRFLTANNRIHLRINSDALKAARLTMSSKILRAAEIVTTQKKQP